MDSLTRWLGARSHRGTVVNIIMLTAILAMADSRALFKVVGGGAAIIAAGNFLFRAVSLTWESRTARGLYHLALIWVPGILASALAVTGLYLTISSEPSSLAYSLGVVLFGAEVSILAITSADLEGHPPTGPVRAA
ncbi:hypothetical protein [Ensifer aridi]|uniref:hypothetical protein n=1 Tax=Ensifer aridi TaxID=1708715 RepID=UPI00111C3BDB|nr:hypothetical protein [Ensifer aridi]